jgi:hypothetical protein
MKDLCKNCKYWDPSKYNYGSCSNKELIEKFPGLTTHANTSYCSSFLQKDPDKMDLEEKKRIDESLKMKW